MNPKAMRRIYFLVIMKVILIRSQNVSNVCSTFEDYFNHISTNPNCWYDAEVTADHKRRAEMNGFLLEQHTIRTDDGHILATFRLKGSSGSTRKEVIFLQHGLATDSICFMSNKENSIAYFLASEGFDVWLGNYRGCENCSHETLTVNDSQYWDFSYHEHGLYDLSANFKYINEKTKQKIIFIGHSMGATGMAVYAAMKANESKQALKHGILISPSLYMRHTRGFASRNLVNNLYELLVLVPQMNLYRILTAGSFEKEAISRICFESLQSLYMCIHFADIATGKSDYPFEPVRSEEANRMIGETLATSTIGQRTQEKSRSIVPCSSVALGSFLERLYYRIYDIDKGEEKFPLAVSAIKAVCYKNGLHYAQSIHTGGFRMFDYGPKKNMARYHRRIPPSYNLNDISIPLSLIYGPTDTLATKEDVIYVFETYGKPSWSLYEIPHSHMDFLFSKSAKETILPLLIKIINKQVK